MFQLRDLKYADIPQCEFIVASHWGDKVAACAALEMQEMFTSNSRWPPHYYVVEDLGGIVGFGGFKAAWMMSNTYELVWVNVAHRALGMGVGSMLTQARLEEIKRRGGTLVLLMTQKYSFFARFGFRHLAVYDGWDLMSKQLGPVTLDTDRSFAHAR